jgi:hypothetical protein
VNDILAAVRDLLEPEPVPPAVRAVAVDTTGAKPLVTVARTLYVYPERVAEAPVETGPTARRDFVIAAVVTGPDAGEEASSQRDPEVSAFLDGKREAYLAAVRANRHGTAWHHLSAAEVAGPTTLEHRSLALRLTGYVIV